MSRATTIEADNGTCVEQEAEADGFAARLAQVVRWHRVATETATLTIAYWVNSDT